MRGAGAALYPPRGTRRSGRGGLLSLTPLRAPGNQTLRQRGRLSLNPSACLDLSHPRPPFLRGPPGPPRGTPTRPLGEPGHPTLKPGSLTRPNRALRRTVPLVSPGEIYHWSPLIDLGFVRLVSDFQGEAGVALCPPSALPSRGTPLRTFPRHRSPRIDLGFGCPLESRYILCGVNYLLEKKKGGLTPDGRPLLRGVFEPTVPAGRRACRVPIGGDAALPRGRGEHRGYVSFFSFAGPRPLTGLVRGGTGLHRLTPSPAAPLAVLKGFFGFPSRAHCNDPSTGSPTETLLRLLLPQRSSEGLSSVY